MNYETFFDSELADLRARGDYRYFAQLEHTSNSDVEVIHHGLTPPRLVIPWCSNDYLCMSRHPIVTEALRKAAVEGGAGSGGSRNIAGTTIHHRDLEQLLARLHRKEAALLFTSAYIANQAILGLLGRRLKGSVIFSDEANHGSIVQGIRSSNSEKRIFRHNDSDSLEDLLQQTEVDRPKIIVTESIFSVDGDLAPIDKIVHLARQYNALLVLDEVNGVGLYGDIGGGIAQELQHEQQVDIVVGTFGKAVGLAGGYIAGSSVLIDYVRSFAPEFIFTTSLPSCIVAAAFASITHLMSESLLRAAHTRVLSTVRAGLREMGIPILNGATRHIIPVVIGSSDKCRALCRDLLDLHSIYLQPINFPTVPRGTERVRITPTPRHTDAMIADFLAAIDAIWKRLDLPRCEALEHTS
jgi:5-aminolevulinate synthase